MKRTYINPTNKVIVLDVVSLLADSPVPGLGEGSATTEGAGENPDVNGGGSGLARGGSLWDEEW